MLRQNARVNDVRKSIFSSGAVIGVGFLSCCIRRLVGLRDPSNAPALGVGVDNGFAGSYHVVWFDEFDLARAMP